MIDGKKGKSFDSVWFPAAAVIDVERYAINPFFPYKFITFSPDKKYIVYGAKLGNEIWWISDEIE